MNPEQANYDFLYQQPSSAPRSPQDKTRRLIMFGVFLMIIILFLVVVFGILLKPDSGPIDRLKTVYKTQGQILATIDRNSTKLRTNEAKILAQGLKLTLNTDQDAVVGLVTKAGGSFLEGETTNAPKADITKKLEAAESNNQLDEEFITTIKAELVLYQQQLTEAYTQSNITTQREVLTKSFDNAEIIASSI